MPDIVADTHSTIWHFVSPQTLSHPARKIMAEAEKDGAIFVSVLSLIEIIYLVERKRVDKSLLHLLREAFDDATSAFTLVNVDRPITDHVEKIPRSEIPEMPDRIIAATALYLGLPIVTKDREIRSLKKLRTIW